MAARKHRPIPREEPEDDAPPPEGPPTVRPPPSASRGSSPSVASYDKLRDSCRVQTVADETQELDDELAVEAEVLRVALDRKSVRAKDSG
jgi:hypothetical protein